MNRRLFLSQISAAGLSACATGSMVSATRVMVVATMHGAHEGSSTYTYDDLYERIASFRPTTIGVEIRPEDLAGPANYLTSYYPAEMIELARRYADIAHGIDWLGSAIEGQPIPDGYFQSLDVKILERALAEDAEFDDPQLDALQSQKRDLLTDATASSLNDGRYDALNRADYLRLSEQLSGTRYELISDFYRMRDDRIAANAVRLIRSDPAGRVAIVVGADHRSAVIDAIDAAFKGRVILEAV